MFNSKPQFIPSIYPIVSRDFSFVLDDNVSYDSLQKAIAFTDGRHGGRRILPHEVIIDEIQVFDVYKGDQMPEGKKCLSVTVDILPTKSTLTSAQIKEICDKIILIVELNTGGTLRQ